MNNRRRQKIRTSFKISQIKFLKMTDEEQVEYLNKFWEKYGIHIKGDNNA